MEASLPEDEAKDPKSKRPSGFSSALSFWKQQDTKLKKGTSQPTSTAPIATKGKSSTTAASNHASSIDSTASGIKSTTSEDTATQNMSPRSDLTSSSSFGATVPDSPKSFRPYTSPRLVAFNGPSQSSHAEPHSPKSAEKESAFQEMSPVPSDEPATPSPTPLSATLPTSDSRKLVNGSHTPTERPIAIPRLKSQTSKYWSSSSDLIGRAATSPDERAMSVSASEITLVPVRRTDQDAAPTVSLTKSPSVCSSGTSSSSDDSVLLSKATIMSKSASSTVIAATKHRDGNTRPLDRLILSSTSKLRLASTSPDAHASASGSTPTAASASTDAIVTTSKISAENSKNGVESVTTKSPIDPTLTTIPEADSHVKQLSATSISASSITTSTTTGRTKMDAIERNDAGSRASGDSSVDLSSTASLSQPSSSQLTLPTASVLDLFGKRKTQGNTSSPIVMQTAHLVPLVDPHALPATGPNMRHIHQMGGSVGTLLPRSSPRDADHQKDEELWARSDAFAQELRSDSSSRSPKPKLHQSPSSQSITSSTSSTTVSASYSSVSQSSSTTSRSPKSSDRTPGASPSSPNLLASSKRPRPHKTRIETEEGAAETTTKLKRRTSPPPAIGHIAYQSSPSLLSSPPASSSGGVSGESSDTSPNQDSKLVIEKRHHKRRSSRDSRDQARRSRSHSKPAFDGPLAEEAEPPSPKGKNSPERRASPPPKIIPIDLSHLAGSSTPNSSPDRDSPASTVSSESVTHFPRRDRAHTPKTASGPVVPLHSGSSPKTRVHKSSSSEYLDTHNDLASDYHSHATPPSRLISKPQSPTVNITHESSEESPSDSASKKRNSFFAFFGRKKKTLSPSTSRADLASPSSESSKKSSKKHRRGSSEFETRPRGNSIATDVHYHREDDNGIVDLAVFSGNYRGSTSSGLTDLLPSKGQAPMRRSMSSKIISLPSSPYDSDSDGSSSLNHSSTEASGMSAVSVASAKTDGYHHIPASTLYKRSSGLHSSSGASSFANTQSGSSRSIHYTGNTSNLHPALDSPSPSLRRRNSFDPTAAKSTFSSEGSSTSRDDLFTRTFSGNLSPSDALFMSTGSRSGKEKKKDKRSTGEIPTVSSFSSPPSPKRNPIFGVALDTFVTLPPVTAHLTQPLSMLSPRSQSQSSEMPPLSPRAECPEWLSLACYSLSTMEPLQLKFNDTFSNTVSFSAKDKNMLRRSIEDGSLDVTQETDAKMIAQAILTFLEDLPDSLCTYKSYADFVSLLPIDDEAHQFMLLHTIFWGLPHAHRCAIILIVDFMHTMAGYDDEFVMENESIRRMDILIDLFAPAVFRARSYSALHVSPRSNIILSELKGTNLASAFSAHSTLTSPTTSLTSPTASLTSPQGHGRASSTSSAMPSQTASTSTKNATSQLPMGPTTSLSSSSLSTSATREVLQKLAKESESSTDLEDSINFNVVIAAPTPKNASPVGKGSGHDGLNPSGDAETPTIVTLENTSPSGSPGRPSSAIGSPTVVPPLRLPVHAASQPLPRSKSETSPGRSPGSSSPSSPSYRSTPRSHQHAVDLMRLVVKHRNALFSLKSKDYAYDASHPSMPVLIEDGALDYLFDLIGNPFYRDHDFAEAFLLNAGKKLAPEDILARLMTRVRSGDASKQYVRTRGGLLLTALTNWVHILVDILALHKSFYAELQAIVNSSKDEDERYVLSGVLAELTIAIGNASHTPTSPTLSPHVLVEAYVPRLSVPLSSHTSEILAEHITLIDMEHFKALKLRTQLSDSIGDFLASEAFVAMTTRFNTLSRWVSYEIVSQANQKERCAKVIYFANVSAALVNMNNFNGALAVFTGINSVNVTRMTKMMVSAKKRAGKILDQLEELFSMTKNSRNYTQRLKSSVMPAIPQIVLFSRILSSLDETNTSFDSSTGHMNVTKFKDYLRISKDFLKYQKSVYYYHKDASIYQSLLALSPPPDDEIYQLSLKADPKK